MKRSVAVVVVVVAAAVGAAAHVVSSRRMRQLSRVRVDSGVGIGIGQAGSSRGTQSLPGGARFGEMNDAHDENDESLQRVADAEDVLEDEPHGTDGQRSGHPRDTQEGHNRYSASHLGHGDARARRPRHRRGRRRRRVTGYFADSSTVVALLQDHLENQEEDDRVDDENRARWAEESAVVNNRVVWSQSALRRRWDLIFTDSLIRLHVDYRS